MITHANMAPRFDDTPAAAELYRAGFMAVDSIWYAFEHREPGFAYVRMFDRGMLHNAQNAPLDRGFPVKYCRLSFTDAREAEDRISHGEEIEPISFDTKFHVEFYDSEGDCYAYLETRGPERRTGGIDKITLRKLLGLYYVTGDVPNGVLCHGPADDSVRSVERAE